MFARFGHSLRFSIAALMLTVGIAGAGFAALRADSSLAADAMFTATCGVLLLAILAACYRQDARRAFWVGFALFGWSYFVLAFAPWFESDVRPRLLTNRLFTQLYPRVVGMPPGSFAHYNNFWLADSGTGKWSLVRNGSSDHFEHTAHCLAALAAGLAGGILGRCLFATRGRGDRDRGPAGEGEPAGAEAAG
jgi:hypothetical protein